MKTLFVALILTLSFKAQATEIKSSNEAAQVNIARVVQLIPLVKKWDINVSVAVKDLGGSTDVSPTQEAYLTLYAKGEMFSTAASFKLGPVFAVNSAQRISGGIYSVEVSVPNQTDGNPVNKTFLINAQKAINAIKSVRCEDFDCDASKNFVNTISLTVK